MSINDTSYPNPDKGKVIVAASCFFHNFNKNVLSPIALFEDRKVSTISAEGVSDNWRTESLSLKHTKYLLQTWVRVPWSCCCPENVRASVCFSFCLISPPAWPCWTVVFRPVSRVTWGWSDCPWSCHCLAQPRCPSGPS